MALRTEAVVRKTINDLNVAKRVIDIVIQIVMIVLCGYNIYTHIDSLFYVISFSVLLGFTVIYLIASFVSKRNIITTVFSSAKKYFNFVVKGVIVGLSLYQMYTTEISDFNKIMTLVSLVSFILQIAFEIFTRIFTYYTDLFVAAFKADTDPLFDAVAKFNDFRAHPTSSILNIVDKPLEKIINKLDNKEDEPEVVREKSKAEKKVDELAGRLEEEKREQKIRNKQEDQRRTTEAKERIGKHLNDIKDRILKK